jgi:hypothetical protein
LEREAERLEKRVRESELEINQNRKPQRG